MRGPYNKTSRSGPTGKVSFYRRSTWYRTDIGQNVRKPLPYSVTDVGLVSAVQNNNGSYWYDAETCFVRQYLDNSWGRSNAYGNTIDALHNRCYAKWLDKVRSAPQVGVDIAEYRQTLSLVQNILKGLKQPISNVAKAYKQYRGNPGKQLLKDMPNVWLPWHFGVEPLIKDLHDLLERLADRGKPQRVTASVSQTLNYSYGPTLGQTTAETYKQHVRISGLVTRVQDNLALWNDIGIVNPASIAWELVPYSFVVDWFYPVGAYVSSLTDLLGYKIQDPYRTWFVTAKGSVTLAYPAVLKSDPSNGIPTVTEGFRLDRALMAPGMVPQKIRIPTSLSVTRAATQIALLLQILNRSR